MSYLLLKEYIELMFEMDSAAGVAAQLLPPRGKRGKNRATRSSIKNRKRKLSKREEETDVREFSSAGGGAIVGHVAGGSPGPKKEWS